jgi:hypothetical protein
MDRHRDRSNLEWMDSRWIEPDDRIAPDEPTTGAHATDRRATKAHATARGDRLTRRQAIKGGAAGLALLGGGGLTVSLIEGGKKPLRLKPTLPAFASGGIDPARAFVSRPDLDPPAVMIAGGRGSSGLLLLGPGAGVASQPGPLLVDHRGQPVWFVPLGERQAVANVRVQTLHGEPVLTWWEGTWNVYGQGEAVIMDSSYRELARVRAANGREMDVHEFVLTPEGTALFTCSPESVQADLSSIGGPRSAPVLQSIIQEVDLRSGRLLFEWRSLDHIPVSESYAPVSEPYDYMHLNSIAVADDGNLLVSARHAWSVYKLERRTGAVMWRLGGKRTDFAMGKDAQFAWQHHASPIGAGLITLFDDGSDGNTASESQSRGIFLGIDSRNRAVKLLRSYTHPNPILATAMGSVQALPNGHVLVGWGLDQCVSEFGASGEWVNDAILPSGLNSYRAFRFPWHGQPAESPVVALRRGPSTKLTTVYVSWNGATHFHLWQVHVGTSARELRPVGIAARQGFETAIPLRTNGGYLAVSALDRFGKRLATSPVVRA